jgi:hypothetical protein
MGLIKEPLDVDFVVDPTPLTEKQKLAISEFIKADKAKRAMLLKNATKKRTPKKVKRVIANGTNR